MFINFEELKQINEKLKEYPRSRLQIVTKNRNIEIIKELIDKGYQLFGENKVQEAKEKFENILTPNIELHLIGPLQTNKVKLAIQLFDTIQSIDRIKLVKEIIKQRDKTAIKTKYFFIQINIGKERQKSGIHPDDLKELYEFCNQNNVHVIGLMCIPPLDNSPEIYFKQMIEIRNRINPKLKLSMGMSSDYKIALDCESNLIRVGSRIFN